MSEHGIYVCDDSESIHLTAHKREITDVSGAGDTVIAVATLCLIAGSSISDIAQIIFHNEMHFAMIYSY